MASEETKERIVAAAEVLFARQGYAATSLRQITETAAVNIAAVNYHFRSKENLLTEVLDRVVGPINDQRLELLDSAETDGTPDIIEVMTAFLLPDLRAFNELQGRDPSLPRFVARMYVEGTELMSHLIGRQFAVIQERFTAAIARALPHLPEDEILWRLHCVVGIVIYLFAGVQASGVPRMLDNDVERNLDRLLALTVPILTAPVGEVVPNRN